MAVGAGDCALDELRAASHPTMLATQITPAMRAHNLIERTDKNVHPTR